MKNLLCCIVILFSFTAYTAHAEVATPGSHPEKKSPEKQSLEKQSTDERPDKKPLSLLVLPFKNNTKDLYLDWLSLALQDNLTIDLWYVKGINTLAIPAYIGTVRLTVRQLSLSDDAEALAVGKKLNVRQVWLGGFSHAGKDGQMLIEIRALDVQGEQEVFSKEITIPPAELPGALDLAVKEILPAYMDIQASPEELERIMSKKTASFKAWEYNARGYLVQQDFSLLGLYQREKYYKKWSSLHTMAVEKDPSYAEAWDNLAWSLYIQGDRTEAKAAFLRALQIKPFYISSNMGMGYILRREKDSDSALKYIRTAVGLNPSLSWTAGQLREIMISSPTSESLPYLLQAFKDSPAQRKPGLLLAIARVKDPSAAKFIGEVALDVNHGYRTRLAAMDILVSSADKSGITYLGEVLKTGDKELKYAALKGMIELDVQASVPHVTDILAGEDFDMKLAAARISREEKIAQAVPYLIKTVNAPSSLSIASIMALAAIGDKSAAPVLREALKNSNSRVRREAATALGDIGDTQSIPELKKTAARDKKTFVRIRALVSLSVLGDRAAGLSLINAVGRGKEKTRNYAIKHILLKWSDMEAPELKDFLTKNGIYP